MLSKYTSIQRYSSIVSLIVIGALFCSPQLVLSKSVAVAGDDLSLLTVLEREVRSDYSIIFWETAEAVSAKISWGKTLDFELGELLENIAAERHELRIYNLDANTQYYFKIEYRNLSNKQIVYVDNFRTSPDPSVKFTEFISGEAVTKLDLDGEMSGIEFEDMAFLQNDKLLLPEAGKISASEGDEIAMSLPDVKEFARRIEIELRGPATHSFYSLPGQSGEKAFSLGSLREGANTISVRFFGNSDKPLKEVSGEIIVHSLTAYLPALAVFLPVGFLASISVYVQKENKPETVVIRRKFDKEHGDDA